MTGAEPTSAEVDTSPRMVKRMGTALLAAPLAVNARAYDMLMALLAERDALVQQRDEAREAGIREAVGALLREVARLRELTGHPAATWEWQKRAEIFGDAAFHVRALLPAPAAADNGGME